MTLRLIDYFDRGAALDPERDSNPNLRVLHNKQFLSLLHVLQLTLILTL